MTSGCDAIEGLAPGASRPRGARWRRSTATKRNALIRMRSDPRF